MNQIQILFNSITDEELKRAITEIKESETTGLIGDVVRKWTKLSNEITGNNYATDLFMTQTNLLKLAAYRWLNQ